MSQAAHNPTAPLAGSIPRDERGNVLPDRKSNGCGALKGKSVEVVRGRKLPIGMVGPVRWHGETKFGWRVGIEVADGAALVWTAAGNCIVTDKDGPDQQSLKLVADLADIGDIPF